MQESQLSPYWEKIRTCYITHSNWVIITLVGALIQFSYTFTLPSMYQFITSPSSASVDKENATFWPGLGEPEDLYLWAVSAFSAGELVMSLAATYLSTVIPYIIAIPLSTVLLVVGGLIYALATHGEMVIMARFLFGSASGLGLVVAQTYIGETAKGISGKTPPSIENMLFFYSISFTASMIVSMGLSVVISLFPTINPYRWGGWFIATTAGLYTIFFVILFEKKIPKTKSMCTSCALRKTLSRPNDPGVVAKTLISYGFVVAYVYVHNTPFSIIDTLLNPMLSDQFGMGTGNLSYFMLAVTLVWTLSSFTILIMKKFKLDSRIGVIWTLSVGLVGMLLLTDWHGYGKNPCNHHIYQNQKMIQNQTANLSDSSFFETSGDSSLSGFVSSGSLEWLNYSTTNNETLPATEDSITVCESLSTSDNKCFWNPNSRVTGEKCNTCRSVCLSQQKSLTIIQFSIGVALIVFVLQPGVAFYVAVASNMTQKRSQGLVLGLLYFTKALSQTINPLWLFPIYEESDHHTYYPMSILAGEFVLILALIPFMYKWIAPIKEEGRPLQIALFYPIVPSKQNTHDTDTSDVKLFLESIHQWMETTTSSSSFHDHSKISSTKSICSSKNGLEYI